MGKSKEAWDSLQEEELENNPVERYEEEESATPMTNETILKKAIERAVKNGYKEWCMTNCDGEITYPKDLSSRLSKMHAFYYIFSHDFAKAFWGDEYPKEMKIQGNFPYWQMELTQLVLQEDPIKYLKRFI